MNTREKRLALREGHRTAAAQAYFAPRPTLDTPEGRRLFEAGFDRGFDHPEHEAPVLLVETVEATTADLYRALLSKDEQPGGLQGAVASTVLHLGLCCLGDRTVRLTLPNGRVLRMVLE